MEVKYHCPIVKESQLKGFFFPNIYIYIKFSHKIFVFFVRKLSKYLLLILNNFNFPSYANHFLILIKIEMPKTILLWQNKRKEKFSFHSHTLKIFFYR